MNKAVSKNIHLLLMSKEPRGQEQQVSDFRCLSIAGTPRNTKCRYSFPGLGSNEKWGPHQNHEWMHRGQTFSMQPKYECKGYELCGILALDLHHTDSAVERLWVFYGGCKDLSGWCKIASTATILELGERHGFMPYGDWRSQGRDELDQDEAEDNIWETPRAWECIVGLRGRHWPSKESAVPSVIDLACSVSATVKDEVFLGHYKHLALVLEVKRNLIPERTTGPP